jgi:glutamate 5-kinase
VGVTKVEGEFKKGDLVKIKNQHGVTIGQGMARYDSKKARENQGKKQKKELVHYNYLLMNV